MNLSRFGVVIGLAALYVGLALAIVFFRGQSANAWVSCAIQGTAGLMVLVILEFVVSGRSADEIDGHYTTAANALIGVGMILSAFTILKATNGKGSMADGILAVAPMALTATAYGLAAGTFFFVRGHVRAARTGHPTNRQMVAEDLGVSESFLKLTSALAQHNRHLDTMARSLSTLGVAIESEEGRSWLETQQQLVEPLSRIASAIDPHGVMMLQRSAEVMSQLVRAMAELTKALAANAESATTQRSTTEGFRAALAQAQLGIVNTGNGIVRAVDDLSGVARGLEKSAVATAAMVTTEVKNLGGRIDHAAEVAAEACLAAEQHANLLKESTGAVADTMQEHKQQSAASAKEITEVVGKSNTIGEQLQTRLKEVTDAVAQLQTALTSEQRGLLDRYLEGLSTSAEKIASQALQHVPTNIERLLNEVQQRITTEIDKATIRTAQYAEQHFAALNEKVAETAKRIKDIAAEFDDFNRAVKTFDASVKAGAENASTNAASFASAADTLSAATERFTAAVVDKNSTERAPLLTLLRTTVEDLSRAAQAFGMAHDQLTAEQTRINRYHASIADIRADAARLKIKRENGTA